MKINKTIKLGLSVFVISASPILADYDDVGTDYSKATTEKWSEDRTNDYVEMASSFACIISKSRPDVLFNNSYETLISEVDCGLTAEETNDSGVSNRSILSSAIMKTSRASNTSPQEGSFWFNAQGNAKFIGDMTIKKSPTDLPPYGEWQMTYYMNDIIPDTSDTYTQADAPQKGYVKISGLDNGNVVIESYDAANFSSVGSPELMTSSSKIQYLDTNFQSSLILGRDVGTNDNNQAEDVIMAAKTNATHMYRATFPSGASSTPTGVCVKRNSVWKTGHEYGVYDKVTGAKLSVSGGFGFNYVEDSVTYRGHVGNWGADFQKRTTAFSSSSTTKSVTSAKDGTAFTLSWAPGKLEKRNIVTEVFTSGSPVNGSTYGVFKKHVDFEDGYNATAKITYNSGTSAYEAKYYKDDGTQITDPYSGISSDNVITSTDISSHGWMGWHYSEEKRSMIYWDGGSSIKFYSDEDVSSNTDLLTASNGWTAFQAVYNDAAGSNLPVNGALFKAASGNPWSYTEKSDSENDNYYFTSATPPTGFLARTLYTDPTGDGPVASATDDKAVMFDFSAYEYQNSDGDWKIKYVPFGAESAADLGDRDGGIWPYKEINLKLKSDTSKKYRWRFGAFGWDNSVIAYKSDNTIHTIEKPKILKYVHAASKDMNEGQTINYFANTTGHNPVKSLCANDSDNKYACEVEPTDFGTKTYNLRYNGNWLEGLPDMEGRLASDDKNSFWMRLINPKAGTEVTETVDGTTTTYVLKPLGIGSSFMTDSSADALTNSSKCGDLKFDALTTADFGWTLDELPSASLLSLSTKKWSDQPTTLKCTVTNGDASNC
jgi:hypothetical protein